MTLNQTGITANQLQSLRDSERRFRAISACTYDWESWHDPNGRVQWVNDAALRLTGFTVDECLAMDQYPLPIVHEADRSRIEEVLQQASHGIPGNDVEFRLIMRTGQQRWGAISWRSIADDDGINMGFRTSVRDIGDRKRLEQEVRNYTENLERLVEERTSRLMELEVRRAQVDRLAAPGQLAAGVAHEINNPLAGIRNAVELILNAPEIGSEDRSLLNLVQSEIDRIGEIVRQLYQLHRPQPASEAEIDLLRLVSQTVQLISGISRRQRVAIQILDSGREPITGSLPEGELKQVLYNILLNAVQASPVDSRVDVDLSADEHSIVIRISDHGSGIDPDVLPKIFDPFFSTKHGTLHTGMGLGLSVSQSLVQAMHGTIGVESGAGQGTVFTVTLPRKTSAPRSSERLATLTTMAESERGN